MTCRYPTIGGERWPYKGKLLIILEPLAIFGAKRANLVEIIDSLKLTYL